MITNGVAVIMDAVRRSWPATPHRSGTMVGMATPPESTKTSLRQRLQTHAAARWPQLAELRIRHHGAFAYLDGVLSDGIVLPLCRLRYTGSAHIWGFAVYLASRNGYQNSFLPNGLPAGSPQDALDCACGLYLADPTAWLTPPTN